VSGEVNKEKKTHMMEFGNKVQVWALIVGVAGLLLATLTFFGIDEWVTSGNKASLSVPQAEEIWQSSLTFWAALGQVTKTVFGFGLLLLVVALSVFLPHKINRAEFDWVLNGIVVAIALLGGIAAVYGGREAGFWACVALVLIALVESAVFLMVMVMTDMLIPLRHDALHASTLAYDELKHRAETQLEEAIRQRSPRSHRPERVASVAEYQKHYGGDLDNRLDYLRQCLKRVPLAHRERRIYRRKWHDMDDYATHIEGLIAEATATITKEQQAALVRIPKWLSGRAFSSS
jgi:hypothetical protein